MGLDNRDKYIAWIATAGFILMAIFGNGPSTYRFAVFFLAPFLWGVYYMRRRLDIHTAHFTAFAIALLFHNLGAFGAYQKSYFGVEFDIYVHFYFGVAGALIVARALESNFDLHGWKFWVGTVLLIMGMGAIHELIEYASTLALGPEKGMLKINSPDKFDTQKDLLNNLAGSLLALTVYSLGFGKYRGRSSSSARTESSEASRELPRQAPGTA